jgi:two-component system, NtrC family, response regulator AtoC
VIERAVLFSDGTTIRRSDLPPEVREGTALPRPNLASQPPQTDVRTADGLKEQVKAAMSRLERDLIQKALEQTNGNVTHAARLLKISRKGLQLKMKELSLREKDERNEP